jgi:signal transduction histidine kinase
MAILLTITENELEEKQLEAFGNNRDVIINKLLNENNISVSWLTQIESSNNLIIHIEDNGYPLTFRGVLHPPTKRTLLIEQLKTQALEEGINIDRNPVFFNVLNSDIIKIKGEHNEFYYGFASIIPTNNGWRSLLLLQYLPDYSSSIINRSIPYVILGVAGILALFLVSMYLISRMIRPIEESNQKQTSFIAAVSHELRSPLSVIMANSAAISVTSNESRKFLEGINKECKRMARLIDDMLLLANMDTKNWNIKSEPVEIDTLLAETYEAYLPLFNYHKLIFELELQEDELPVIQGDRDRLSQILAILLDNAISYTPAGKKVTLRGYKSVHYLNIEIEDQGVGITDEDKEHIFDRFYRADPSRSDKKHFGLGLSIANELVQYHGGKISVRDSNDAGGSTFVIQLHI